MDDIVGNTLPSTAKNTDKLRRRIGLASLRAKLETCELMLNTATDCLDEETFGDEAFEQCEACYAAAEETMKTLELVQLLCVRLSGTNQIPKLEKFAAARQQPSGS
jgi:hypothetical protein